MISSSDSIQPLYFANVVIWQTENLLEVRNKIAFLVRILHGLQAVKFIGDLGDIKVMGATADGTFFFAFRRCLGSCRSRRSRSARCCHGSTRDGMRRKRELDVKWLRCQ